MTADRVTPTRIRAADRLSPLARASARAGTRIRKPTPGRPPTAGHPFDDAMRAALVRQEKKTPPGRILAG
jgi:hypothetical protein